MIPSHTVPSTAITGGSKCILVISELDCVYSNCATKTVSITPTEKLCVADIVNAILSASLEKYEFDSNGVGCRMWTISNLRLLQGHGWGVSSECGDAVGAITKLWRDGTDLPLDHGACYST